MLRNRGGYGKTTAHAHVIMFDALPVGRTASPSKKLMEPLRTFVFVETVVRHGRLFQGSDEYQPRSNVLATSDATCRLVGMSSFFNTGVAKKKKICHTINCKHL